jgi:hypothetical protein
MQQRAYKTYRLPKRDQAIIAALAYSAGDG